MFFLKYKLELLVLSLAGLVFLSQHITLWIAFILLSLFCLFVNIGLLIMLPTNLELQEEIRKELKQSKKSFIYKAVWAIELFLLAAVGSTSMNGLIITFSSLVIVTELVKVYQISRYKEKAS